QAGAKTGGVDWSQMWNAAPQYEDSFTIKPPKINSNFDIELKELGLENVNESIDKELKAQQKRVQDGKIQANINGNWVDCKNEDDVKWTKICTSGKNTTVAADGKTIIANGCEYPIYSPKDEGRETVISAPWETIDSYNLQNVSFNPMKGFAEMDLSTTDYGGGYSMGAGVVGFIANALHIGIKSTDTVNYTISLQKQNAGTPYEKARAIVNVGSSEDRMRKLNLEANKEYSMVRDIPNKDDGSKKAEVEVAIMRVYEQYTGEKADFSKQYDVKYTFDEDYLKNPNSGILSKGENGKLCYTPAKAGITAYIVESDWGDEISKVPITID
ncbi:MAG: hypothetical protein RR873_07975, partial [Christensenella sp.]